MDEHLTKAFSDLTGLVSRLAGPLADELGMMAGDRAREYRIKNAVKIFKRIKTFLAEAGIAPDPIPPRLFLPAMDAATVEDNDVLQEKWAALLANASDPLQQRLILPSFVEILKELTPEEVKFIHNVYHNAPPHGFVMFWESNRGAEKKPNPKDRGLRIGNYDAVVSLSEVGESVSLIPPDTQQFSLIVDDLVRLGLLDRLPWYPTPMLETRQDGLSAFVNHPQSAMPGDSEYFIPPFALAFLRACEPPTRSTDR